jgi:hypothetical protein
MISATMSRQLPPQTLTTSFSCAMAVSGESNSASAPMAVQIRFILVSLGYPGISARHYSLRARRLSSIPDG